jgi:molybdopterin molybdotransferase
MPSGEAIGRVLERLETPKSKPIELARCTGLVSAATVRAQFDVPRFDNSSMDGYSVNSAQFTANRTGPAARISTGMPLPSDADAVVPWEHATKVTEDTISTTMPVESGQYVRRRGHDFATGDVIVERGATFTSAQLGALAAFGISECSTYPPPVVGILTTGSELRSANESLDNEASIFDSNTTMLHSLLVNAGVSEVRVATCADDHHETLARISELANSCDVVVTTGGASVGERDWVRQSVSELGTKTLWRVALRPGKPFFFDTVDQTPVFGLPGNPASAFTCFHVFVRPAIRRLMYRSSEPATVMARLSQRADNPGERTWICPVQLTDSIATPIESPSSQALSPILQAQGLIEVSPDSTLQAGTIVAVELI